RYQESIRVAPESEDDLSRVSTIGHGPRPLPAPRSLGHHARMLARLLVGVVVTVAWVSSAHAADRIYIESYPGPRPRDADRVLQAARSELQQIGFQSVARLGAKG